MSIQDESFPYDELDLEISCSSGKHLIFPHHKPRRGVLVNENDELKNATSVQPNTSSSSLPGDVSTLSSNDLCPVAETSGKTNSSEPTDMKENQTKKSEYIRHNTNKSISYQDIHSEYTKRRYKHVESKVGQYIANIKAQDEKRRNSGKFQRHRSMPETLHAGESAGISELHNESKKRGILRHSVNDLDSMHELQSDHEMEIYDNLTATTSSSSTRELASGDHIYLDKESYELLMERKDFLQSELNEKNAECWRLKHNLDTMRIEYSLCKDKLKQQTQSQRFSGSFGSITAGTTLGRNSLHSSLYTLETKEKSTQTEGIPTPSPAPVQLHADDMFVTPLNPDSNNNNTFDPAAVGVMAPAHHKVSKTIATIQPLSLNFSNLVEQENRDLKDSPINNTINLLRQRSNSMAARKKSTPLPNNISVVSSIDSSVPNSSDSAIDSEVNDSPKCQRQSRREEFVYYNSQQYAVLETRNAGRSYTNDSSQGTNSEIAANNDRRNKRKRNLRTRIKRFFGACTKCEDPNASLDISQNAQQQSYSQIPLLEKSSQNYCSNMR